MSKNNELPINELERQKRIMSRINEMSASQKIQPLAYIDTYGCQQNESDSEKLRGMLKTMGYGPTGDEYAADVLVVNTCAIRENAENRVYGNVGELLHTKKAKPSQIIALCGCMAAIPEVAEKIGQSYKHVDFLFPPNMIWRFPEMLYSAIFHEPYTEPYTGTIRETNSEPYTGTTREPYSKPYDESSIDPNPTFAPGGIAGEAYIIEGLPQEREGTVKAWLPIMYGCNNYCSYCIVPYVRGRERSRKPEAVLDEARKLVADGYKDITLLGQNVNSYGAGQGGGVDFSELIRQINGIQGEFLIRFMTSHPKDASSKLFLAMAECEKAARHIHLPFQAGNDRILRLMNRGYSQSEYLEKINVARELMPDIVITSDVIVGFPGETDAEFEDTLRLVEKAQFDAMFTFIFSKRPGTPAAGLTETVTREEKQARFDRLLELQNSISAKKHSHYVGKTLRVLIDGISDDGPYPLKARTNGGRLVHLEETAGQIGSFIDAEITHNNSWSLFGTAK